MTHGMDFKEWLASMVNSTGGEGSTVPKNQTTIKTISNKKTKNYNFNWW